jgi:glycosyltransferase involved in cell wall biosynthesis
MISLSIITVNMNSGDDFEKTVNSVRKLNALYPIEHIIIDGGSTDRSGIMVGRLVCNYFKILIESDDGIYDAMNKGIRLTTSDYTLFLNSGDVLNSPLELSKVLQISDNKFDVYYSDLILATGQVVEQRINKLFLLHNCTNHQSMIIRNNKLIDGYSLQYRICADFDWLISNESDLECFKLTTPLSIYDVEGVSSILSRERRLLVWSERWLIFFRCRGRAAFRLTGLLTSFFGMTINFLSPGILSRLK